MAAPVQGSTCRAHYTYTVSNTAVPFATVVTDATHRAKVTKCTIQANGASLSFRYDLGGATVTASNGFILADGGFSLLDQGNATINALQFIRAGGTNVTLVIALEWAGN